ncbi:hypothetical protein [Virgibacillus ihumii]|uniref:hypothetical protein n=1 Tax=Virgibacillus ihumii TaxID=2686091 RepID=UPI00157DC882|nr:hypothetical protein [Virgibacillus ihumii]
MSYEAENHGDDRTELKRLLDEVQSGENNHKPHQTNESTDSVKKERGIDVLNLPPRKDVHSAAKSRKRVKINHALFRLIFVIILIIIVLGGIFYLWGEEVLNLI